MIAAVLILFVVAAAQALPAPQVSFTHPGRSFYQDQAGQFRSSERSYQGTEKEERGYLKTLSDGSVILARDGTVQWTSPEGLRFQLGYTADESGFHTQGNAIPVASV